MVVPLFQRRKPWVHHNQPKRKQFCFSAFPQQIQGLQAGGRSILEEEMDVSFVGVVKQGAKRGQ